MRNIFASAESDDPEALIRATQQAIIGAMRDVIADLRIKVGEPGLTWSQLDLIIEEFSKKEPLVFEQMEEF